MAFRTRMTVAYDGTAYAGWQIQPDAVTIQGTLEQAVGAIAGEPVRVHCSGRTDTGVHARAQVVHFDLSAQPVLKRLQAGLNGILPEDIRILVLRRASPDFDARRHATGKEYRYLIWNGNPLPPFIRRYRCHVPRRLDVSAMQAAARVIEGAHDFTAFSANPNRDVPSNIRNLRTLRVSRKGHEVVIIAEGNGFLYKMVRSLAGYLIRAGHGDLSAEDGREILASRVRTARIPTAPPQGLFLWKVDYAK